MVRGRVLICFIPTLQQPLFRCFFRLILIGKPHGDINKGKSEVDSNHNPKKPVSSVYSYASVEFRPLQITDEGCFSTPILEGNKAGSSKTADATQNELQAYEEVTIPSGNFDKINPESILVKSQDTSGGNTALAAFTADMELSPNNANSDTYAAVDNSSHQTRKKPPPIPKPYAKPKDNADAPDGARKKPPPLPKPYSTRKEILDEPIQTPGMYTRLRDFNIFSFFPDVSVLVLQCLLMSAFLLVSVARFPGVYQDITAQQNRVIKSSTNFFRSE